jgi:glutaminyl-peptide cyclotransferase
LTTPFRAFPPQGGRAEPSTPSTIPHTVRSRSQKPAALILAVVLPLAVPLALLMQAGSVRAQAKTEAQTELWDGQRAMGVIGELLRFTPRSMETAGHQQTIDYIKAELAKTKAEPATLQRWVFRSEDGKRFAMTNIVARFQPSNPRRVIVATHYDSIIKAYRDAKKPDAPMPGANNSSSGVAVLLETARVLSLLPPPEVGIDFVFFDGEEGSKSLGAGDPDFAPIGSPYFAAHLPDFYPAKKPEKAVDLDMVCDRDLHLKPDPSSIDSAGPEVKKFWDIGMATAPSSFDAKPLPYAMSDDHTALAAAGIPSFLVIDFEYEPFYNTTQDTLDKCSPKSLEAVGRTLLQYLYAP